MGGKAYDFQSRSLRTESFKEMDFNQQFIQQDKGRIHESMDPHGITLRESRDNEYNPETFPTMMGLDITGSMHEIPRLLIMEGLPTMVGKMKERGVKDPAILFMGLGDSSTIRRQYPDKAPFQVGQFESNDELLDQWLTRTWIEQDGGGNGGESYLWAWWLAAYKTATDAWDKRGKKGLLVTIGNEPCHPYIQSEEFQRVIGQKDETVSMKTLYEEASKRWEIYHLYVNNRPDAGPSWREFLGDHAIEVNDYKQIPQIIAELASKGSDTSLFPAPPKQKDEEDIKITL